MLQRRGNRSSDVGGDSKGIGTAFGAGMEELRSAQIGSVKSQC
jgi:hypothetical protein